MNKELIDRAWACLPREFKEEVKKQYDIADDSEQHYTLCTLEYLFGYHNITSDADGEDEMLCVSRKEVQEIYTQNQSEITRENVSSSDKDCYEYANEVLKTLFGPKCLPDEVGNEINFATKEPTLKRGDIVRVTNARHSLYEGLIGTVDTVVKGGCHEILVNHSGSLFSFHASELKPYEKPKPVEPKFKEGDMVKIKGDGYEPNLHKGDVGEVLDINDKEQCFVLFKKSQAWIYTDCLEPYTEPTNEGTRQEQCVPKNAESGTRSFDRILKDSFRNERRLNIAAMALQGMLSNTTRFSSYEISDLVRISLNCADALIKKVKGGSDE